MGHLPTVQTSCVTNSWMMLMDCLAIASKNTTSTKPILPQHQAKLATSCGISSVTIFDTSATTFSISCLLRKPSTARLQAVFVKFLGEHQLRASTTHGCKYEHTARWEHCVDWYFGNFSFAIVVQGPMLWWWPGSKWLYAWSTSVHMHIAAICCNPPKFERITHYIRRLVNSTKHIGHAICLPQEYRYRYSMRINISLQGLHLVMCLR